MIQRDVYGVMESKRLCETPRAGVRGVKAEMVAHAWNPSIPESEAGGSLNVQHQPGLDTKFKASWIYTVKSQYCLVYRTTLSQNNHKPSPNQEQQSLLPPSVKEDKTYLSGASHSGPDLWVQVLLTMTKNSGSEGSLNMENSRLAWPTEEDLASISHLQGWLWRAWVVGEHAYSEARPEMGTLDLNRWAFPPSSCHYLIKVCLQGCQVDRLELKQSPKSYLGLFKSLLTKSVQSLLFFLSARK